MSQYHFNPETYETLMAEEVPSYGRLQEEVAAATQGRRVTRILDLGTGTGITARRVLDVHPRARLVGIDENPQMLAKARGVLPTEADLRVAQLEDPLPRGSFDLVVSALAVHHLEGAAKADLFRRIANSLAPGGRFVLGDLIIPDDPGDVVTPIDGVHDKPSTKAEQLVWLRDAGLTPTTAWLERDLCVLIGDLDHAPVDTKRENSPASRARTSVGRDGGKDRSRQSGAPEPEKRSARPHSTVPGASI